MGWVAASVRVKALKTRSSVVECAANFNLRRKLAVEILVRSFRLGTPVGDESSEELFFEGTKVRAFQLAEVDVSEFLEGVVVDPGLLLVPGNSFSDQFSLHFLSNSNDANIFPAS